MKSNCLALRLRTAKCCLNAALENSNYSDPEFHGVKHVTHVHERAGQRVGRGGGDVADQACLLVIGTRQLELGVVQGLARHLAKGISVIDLLVHVHGIGGFCLLLPRDY
jgi:hypothetical protein